MLNLVPHKGFRIVVLQPQYFRICDMQHIFECLLRTALRRTGRLLSGLLLTPFGVRGTQSRDACVQAFSLLLNARMLHRRVVVPDGSYGSEPTSNVERFSLYS